MGYTVAFDQPILARCVGAGIAKSRNRFRILGTLAKAGEVRVFRLQYPGVSLSGVSLSGVSIAVTASVVRSHRMAILW